MARLSIDTGTAGNPNTGDSLRVAMGKINSNFIEIYDDLAGAGLNGLLTNNTTNGDVKIQPNGTGIVEVDQLQINSDSITSLVTNGNVAITGNGTGSVSIQGLTFPTSDGTNGQVLTTDGAGNLSFTSVNDGITFSADDSAGVNVTSGGSLYIQGGTGITTSANSDGTITVSSTAGAGLQSRATKAGSAAIQDGSTTDIDITGYIGYALYKVQTSHAARVRVYVSDQARDADATRAEGTDPTADAGVIAEVITTGAETVLISPGAIGFNDDSTVTTNIPIKVTNKIGDSASTTITVTLHLNQLES